MIMKIALEQFWIRDKQGAFHTSARPLVKNNPSPFDGEMGAEADRSVL